MIKMFRINSGNAGQHVLPFNAEDIDLNAEDINFNDLELRVSHTRLSSC